MKSSAVLPLPLRTIPVAVLGVAFLLAGCAETRLVLHAAKKLSKEEEPADSGAYKVGKPYKVAGTWYYPRIDYAYNMTGIASWYGPKFHRKRTANGQIFDMNAISAAHRTLPLPSLVQVTNLENGRSLEVLVNDRGPFAHGRIIDLSRRAAQLLGFERAGTARVRVEILPEQSRRLAALARQGVGTPRLAGRRPAPVRVAELPPPQRTDVKIVPVSGKTSLFIQAGAFIQRDLAVKTERDLALIGPTQIIEAKVGEQRFYRVRLGPLSTVDDGDRILDAVVRTGYPDARLVVY